MNKEGSVIGDISQNTKEYIRLHIDGVKLSVVEKVSILSSKALALIVVSTLLTIFAMLIVAAAVVALSYVVGLLYSLLIISGTVLLISILIWIFRGRFMVNAMVRMYCKLMFDGDEKE